MRKIITNVAYMTAWAMLASSAEANAVFLTLVGSCDLPKVGYSD